MMTVMVMYNDVDQVGTSDIGDIDDRGVGNVTLKETGRIVRKVTRVFVNGAFLLICSDDNSDSEASV